MLALLLVSCTVALGGFLWWTFHKAMAGERHLVADISSHDPCQFCDDPHAATLRQTKVVGVLIGCEKSEYALRVCQKHAQESFAFFMKKNLLFGWWSLISPILLPICLCMNAFNYQKYKSALLASKN